MKIYVTHSSSFDFKTELYEPIRNSKLNNLHEIILPHEFTNEQFDSKRYIPNCDLVLAEVSFPSTGQGIELGWAFSHNKPILCLYKKGTKPSGALKVVTDNFIEYKDKSDLLRKLTKKINNL